MKTSLDVSQPLSETQTVPLGHSFEARICHDLLAHPELKFSSLVVHRTPDGVCLEGVVTSHGESSDVCRMVREVAGVDAVLNHLVLRPQQASTPKKG